MTTSFIEQEKLAEQNDMVEPESPPIEAVDSSNAFLKCVNYHHVDTDEATNVTQTVARDTDDIDKYLPNSRDKPCLICNGKSQRTSSDTVRHVDQPMEELCAALCDDKCKSSTVKVATATPAAVTNDTSGKILARSNSSRQEFLASMLQEATILVEAPQIVTVAENDKETDKIAEQTAAAVVVDNLKELGETYFRDKLNVAEALVQTTMLTSPAANRRLAARQMEMNLSSADFVYDSENSDYIPPKELLMYLVR